MLWAVGDEEFGLEIGVIYILKKNECGFSCLKLTSLYRRFWTRLESLINRHIFVPTSSPSGFGKYRQEPSISTIPHETFLAVIYLQSRIMYIKKCTYKKKNFRGNCRGGGGSAHSFTAQFQSRARAYVDFWSMTHLTPKCRPSSYIRFNLKTL